MDPASEPTSRGSQPAAFTQQDARPGRLPSLDAYRGAIVLLMASSGLGLAAVAERLPGYPVWKLLAEQSDHAQWSGCRLWDLIQPAFMFMVGVALPWSIANRQARGESFGRMLGHALRRSLILVLLAVFLSSAGSGQTLWSFNSVLAQIGLGYLFLFLLAFTKPRIQWLAASGILLGYWLLFAVHPLPQPGFDWSSVGLKPDWPHLGGFAAHWEKNANAATAFDQWFLNLFPREKPYVFSPGGYHTLNFVPSLATMIFGLLAGGLLKGRLSVPHKVGRLAAFGVTGVLLGLAVSWTGLCPIVKRIWTPAWAIYSGGWVTLMLAGFVAVLDWRGWRRWAFPCVVAGVNPITLYCMWQLLPGFVSESMKTHLGRGVFEVFGVAYAPILQNLCVLLVFWLVLLWMYHRKLFIRI
jgi:heparan-alpha-glucosaminide N-acetyltransferase